MGSVAGVVSKLYCNICTNIEGIGCISHYLKIFQLWDLEYIILDTFLYPKTEYNELFLEGTDSEYASSDLKNCNALKTQ